MTAPHLGDVSVTPSTNRDAALREWLGEVYAGSRAGSTPPATLRRRLTLPVRAARRFRSLVAERGLADALSASAEYAGRRVTDHPLASALPGRRR